MNQHEKAIYNYIVKFALENGFLPTRKEISENVYLAVSEISRHMTDMEKKQIIEKQGKRYKVSGLRYVHG